MVGVFPLDQLHHLAADRLATEARHVRRRWIAGPRLSILGVEAELAADRLPLLHQDSGVATHRSIERVHSPWGRPVLLARVELLRSGQPTFVRSDPQSSIGDEGRELGAELPLRRLLHFEGAELGREFTKRRCVRLLRHSIANRHSSARLLQREVTLVGENERELLSVVGTSRGLRRAFEQHDADLAGRRLCERSDSIGELVVRDVHPLPLADLGRIPRRERLEEVSHAVTGASSRSWRLDSARRRMPWSIPRNTGPWSGMTAYQYAIPHSPFGLKRAV